MHKGVILLIKADNKEDARTKADSFMERYENDVWDWYCIGGRWSGELNKNKDKFFELVDKKWPRDKESFGRSYDWIEKHLKEFQEIWESLGETSKNPYSRDTFISRDYNTVYEDNIMKASECVEIIKSWFKDIKEEAEENWKKAEVSRKEEKEKQAYPMSGYYANKYHKCVSDYFSFDSNIFDIENESNYIPEDLSEYFAIMVDMHN